MDAVDDLGPVIAGAAGSRAREIVAALRGLDEEALLAPSQLPDWSRLTIACHLRYGAEALDRMTRAALAGVPTAYYPEGRDRQRPGTLLPRGAKQPDDVVASLARRSEQLDTTWRALNHDDWQVEVIEPEERRDLGPMRLTRLALLRLTEVEVHGSDLGLGVDDWSEFFVDVALPFRVEWLNTRRSNHRPVEASVRGSWLLVAVDGPSFVVSVDGDRTEARQAGSRPTADAVIEATSRDLLALLLGRPPRTAPCYSDDTTLAEAFTRVFPGP